MNTKVDYIILRELLNELFYKGFISFDEWYKTLVELRIAYSLTIAS